MEGMRWLPLGGIARQAGRQADRRTEKIDRHRLVEVWLKSRTVTAIVVDSAKKVKRLLLLDAGVCRCCELSCNLHHLTRIRI